MSRPISRQRIFAAIVFPSQVLLGVVAVALSGCPSNDVPLIDAPTPNSTTGGDAGVGSQQKQLTAEQRRRLSQCEDNLVNIIDGMSFDRLGIDADPRALLADLNNWLVTCGPDDDAEPLASDVETRKKTLPDAFVELTEKDTFLDIDLAHIRDSLLSKAIGEVTVSDASDDLKVIDDLFNRVVRNVTLVAANFGDLPLDPSTLWLHGIGTARDRAWLFSQLLRQYQIDTVVIEFPSGFNADPYILVAAVTRGETPQAYLYDPITGLPIPALDDNAPLPSTPATWSEVAKSEKIFQALDRGSDAYPVRTDRLDTAQLFVVGDISLFSPRMALLQDTLPPGDDVRLYEGLGENKLASPPLLKRLAKVLSVDEGRLRVWPHGTNARVASTKLSETTEQIVRIRSEVLMAPYTVEPVIDPNTGEPATTPDGKVKMMPVGASTQNESNVLTGRLSQLAGDSRKALMAYLAARGPKFQLEVNQIAATDAEYWVAVTQYESGRADHAKKSLEKFLAKPFKSIWEASARRLLMTIDAEQGDFKAALQAAVGENVDPGTLALIARWKELGLLKGLIDGPTDSAKKADTKKTDETAKPTGETPEAKPEPGGGEEKPAPAGAEMKKPSDGDKPAEPAGADESSKPKADKSEASANNADMKKPESGDQKPAVETPDEKPADKKPSDAKPETEKPDAASESAKEPAPVETNSPKRAEPAADGESNSQDAESKEPALEESGAAE